MSNIKHIIALIVVIALALLSLSVFTIKEGQRGLELKLGRLMTNPVTGDVVVYKPGIHFKLPFIVKVKKFDARLQTLDVQSSRILTAEQKYVLADYYVKWRIENFPLYFKRTSDNAIATDMLLQQKINDKLRAAFGKRTITEVISGDRSSIMAILRTEAEKSAEHLGIDINDVRIVQIDLPKEVSDSVFQRMRTQREQVATQHRAQGKAQAEAIKADADAKVAIMLAKTKAKSEQVRANGDTQAASIYNAAYAKDKSFYIFYRALQAYQTSLNGNSFVILGPKSEFLHYLRANSLLSQNRHSKSTVR